MHEGSRFLGLITQCARRKTHCNVYFSFFYFFQDLFFFFNMHYIKFQWTLIMTYLVFGRQVNCTVFGTEKQILGKKRKSKHATESRARSVSSYNLYFRSRRRGSPKKLFKKKTRRKILPAFNTLGNKYNLTTKTKIQLPTYIYILYAYCI